MAALTFLSTAQTAAPTDGKTYSERHTSTDQPPIYRIGDSGVTAPHVIFTVDPKFSEAARREKISGNVLVSLILDTQGYPTQVRIVRGVGYGLDEEAIDAVRQYRFQPATKDGVPVKVEMTILVNFRIVEHAQ